MSGLGDEVHAVVPNHFFILRTHCKFLKISRPP